MRRIADRGAITAAWVGVGMAVVIAVSFLLVIPIEAIVWLLALPAGALIGYYANTRSDRRAGPWHRIVSNALVAAAATALTFAVLILATKALFFFGDTGYPDFNRVDASTHQPIPPTCQTGADCVYDRYLAAGRGAQMEQAGIDSADAFTPVYWREQAATALTVIVLTMVGGLLGAGLYLVARPKPSTRAAASPG